MYPFFGATSSFLGNRGGMPMQNYCGDKKGLALHCTLEGSP